MKLLSYFTQLKSDKVRKSDHLETKLNPKEKKRVSRQQVVSIYPMVRIQDSDWLKLYRAMDTAG